MTIDEIVAARHIQDGDYDHIIDDLNDAPGSIEGSGRNRFCVPMDGKYQLLNEDLTQAIQEFIDSGCAVRYHEYMLRNN